MGRAQNSFTSWVGHAEETISDDRVTLPEKDLWVAVLCRAVLDACKGPPDLDMTRKANISHQNHYTYNILVRLSKTLLPDAQLSISKTVEALANEKDKKLNGKIRK